MLGAVLVFLLVVWLLGVVSSYTAGGYIHVLPAVVILVVLMRVIQGRRRTGG
ncbi:MAG TPA: lmo0937 family membrane protein [Vicinamibacterales bacterium]